MRHQQLNVLFLLLALAGIGFGIFGFLHGDRDAPANTVAYTQPDQDESDPARPLDKQKEERVAQEAPSVRSEAATTATSTSVQTKEDDPALERPDWDGKISGRVVDHHGSPLSGIRVTAVDHDLINANRPDWQTDPASIEASLREQLRMMQLAVLSVITNSNGGFELTRLNPDKHYEVVANGAERGRTSHWNIACGTEMFIVLDASSMLTLKVSDPEGEPIKEIRLSRYSPNMSSSGSETSRNGTYYINWNGNYDRLKVAADGFVVSRDITISDAGDLLEVTLQHAPLLSGTVTDNEGEPIANARVQVSNGIDPQGNEMDVGEMNWDNSAETDSVGRYRIDWLSPGRYTLTFRLGYGTREKPVIREVDLTSDVDLDVALDTGGRVSVNVADPEGKPVMDYSVSITDENRSWIGTKALPSTTPGMREFVGLPDGKVRLTVSARGCAPYATEIDTSEGEQTLNVTLAPGATVTGRVLDVNGTPLAGLRLRWTPTGKDLGVENDVWSYPDEDGTYTVGPLQPGSWVVNVYLEERTAEKAATQNVQLSAGAINHDLILESPRSLQLALILPKDEEVEWVDVMVRKEGDVDTMDFYLYPEENQISMTIPFLPAGTYFIYATGELHASPLYKVTLESGTVTCNVAMGAPNCLRISTIADNSNAKNAGVQVNDVVLEYDYQTVSGMSDLLRLTKEADGRSEVSLKILRNGNELELTVGGGLLGINAEPARR